MGLEWLPPLFLSPHFCSRLHEKSHGNKTGCIFTEQFVENAEAKTKAVAHEESGGTNIA